MKTNKIIKSIVIVMLILTVCSFAVPAMADRGGRNESSRYGAPAGEKGKNETELSVTAEREMSVSGKAERKDGKNRPERPMDDADDDRFEDRGKGRSHGVDFSELPEEPTDEEIVEFFKKYFMGNDPARTADGGSDEETGKDLKKDSRPFARHKDCSCRSDDPADETAAEVPETAEPVESNETVPEVPESAEPAEINETVPEIPETEPVEEQPAEAENKNAA